MSFFSRQNPIFFERDGDLNPTWLFVIIYLIIGAVGSVVAMFTGHPQALLASLGFVASMTVTLLISALPRDRAKILANSKAPGDIARGVAAAGGFDDILKHDDEPPARPPHGH